MSAVGDATSGTRIDNTRGLRGILALSGIGAAVYLGLALAGDLRQDLALYYGGFAVLLLLMLAAWRVVRPGTRSWRVALGAALLFRAIAALGEPALSDDVYRYVWDGRVQLHGFHPYRYAPDDPRLAQLRDADWPRINHPEVKTIYPPLAQLSFAVLARLGAGPNGFRLILGLLDFGVVLALSHLLGRLSRPRDRLLLYAWNPLAVLETSGSGHVEPLGVLLMLLAGAWIIDRRPMLSTLALAAAVQVKLVPALLIPGQLRRAGPRVLALLGLGLLLPAMPYALTGPALGAGLGSYAERWERNATIYAVVEEALERIDTGPPLKRRIDAMRQGWPESGLPWEFLYAHVWPRDLARVVVGLAALVWIALTVRRRLELPRENLLVLGGVLLLSPTLHPWYLLWVLPWAVICGSRAWLVLGATIALSYAHATEVPWTVRALEFLPALAVAVWDRRRALW